MLLVVLVSNQLATITPIDLSCIQIVSDRPGVPMRLGWPRLAGCVTVTISEAVPDDVLY
jgi:hypothetical protein